MFITMNYIRSYYMLHQSCENVYCICLLISKSYQVSERNNFESILKISTRVTNYYLPIRMIFTSLLDVNIMVNSDVTIYRRLVQGQTSEIERSGHHVRVLSRLRHSRPFNFVAYNEGPPWGTRMSF